MAICIKSTILKLEENKKNIRNIGVLYILNMLNFKRLALIATEIPHPASNETKSFGPIPSPHPVYGETKSFGSTSSPHPQDAAAKKLKWQSISNQQF